MEECMGHREDVETPPNDADAGRGAAPEQQGLEELLSTARAEAQQNWDRYLRTAAELENLRRRNAQELERVQKFGIERFAHELLGVIDSLEMGLAAADAEGTREALRDGMEATLKQFDRAFEKFGITRIDPAGQPFDPTLHEAISVQPSDQTAADHVLTVVQKGYLLNGRLLRPARVIVARGAPGANP
jgi:molecular chaperone GrpE